MSCGNFNISARNKMFIGVFHCASEGLDDNGEINEDIHGEDFYEGARAKIKKIFQDDARFVNLEGGYYEGASIDIDYKALAYEFDFDGEGAKKRKALRIKLEKKFRQLKKELEEEFEGYFDIVGMGVKGVFSSGETIYDTYKKGKEEI